MANQEGPQGSQGPSFDIAHEVGSREFERPLRRLGLPVRVRFLSCGDFAFYGHGPRGLVRIGVERKTIAEMVGEASRRRFTSRQLPRMLKRYQYCFLIVEGRTNIERSSGLLMDGKDINTKRGQPMTLWHVAGWGTTRETFENFFKRDLTLRLKAAIQVIPTGSTEETAFTLHALYRWWQKDWSAHRSCLALDTEIPAQPDGAILDFRSWYRDMLGKIPYVSWKRSLRVANYFPSMADAVMGTEEDWMKALGVKKGRVMARRIVRLLHGLETDDVPAKGA